MRILTNLLVSELLFIAISHSHSSAAIYESQPVTVPVPPSGRASRNVFPKPPEGTVFDDPKEPIDPISDERRNDVSSFVLLPPSYVLAVHDSLVFCSQ